MAKSSEPTWRGSVFARGRKLWLKVKGPGGWKQVPTSFHVGEEKRAQALLARVRDRLAAGEGLDGLLGPVTVRRWSKRWLEMRKGVVEDDGSDESVLRLHVLTHIGDMELGEVKPRHVAALVRSWMTEDYAPRTIRNVYYTMKSMFRDAAVEGLIDATPCILGRAQLPRIVDADPECGAQPRSTRATRSSRS
jgi:hypothetical protein